MKKLEKKERVSPIGMIDSENQKILMLKRGWEETLS